MSAMLLANAGTILMWGAIFHLLFGNLLIGIMEGLLLRLVFRVKIIPAVFIMIAANYFSAWAAYIILQGLPVHLSDQVTLYNIQQVLWLGFGAAFLFTLFVEFPFVCVLFYRQRRWVLRSIMACVLINGVSYCVLAGGYYLVSAKSLFRNAVIVPGQAYTIRNPQAVLYYVGEDSTVCRMRLDGSELEVFYEPENQPGDVILYFRQNTTRRETDLYLARSKGLYVQEVSNDVCLQEGVPVSSDLTFSEERSMNEREANDYRPVDQRQWRFSSGFWAAGGLLMWNDQTRDIQNIALETPFVQWYVRYATVLPGDEVIFQFGRQICIFDRESRKLAVLTQGTSPVVVLENN